MTPNDSKESEQSNPGRFDVGQINIDPYGADHILYLALKSLGFPIEFEPDITETYGEFRGAGRTEVYLRVLTDSEGNRKSIKALKNNVLIHGIRTILFDIDDGRPHTLSKLLRGNEEEYYHRLSPLHIDPSRRYPIDNETLKRCFMAAYERHHERVEDGTAYYPSAAPDEEDKKLYEQFQHENLKPIDPEALGIMTMQVIGAYMSKHSRYKPR